VPCSWNPGSTLTVHYKWCSQFLSKVLQEGVHDAWKNCKSQLMDGVEMSSTPTNFGFFWSLLWVEGMVATMMKYMAKRNWRTLTLQTLIAWFWNLQLWLRNLGLVNLDMVICLCYSGWKWVRCSYFSWHVWLSAEVAKWQISETLAKYTCHFKRSPVNFLAYSVSMGECC